MFGNLLKAIVGSTEAAASDATKMLRQVVNSIDEKDRFAGHCSLWKAVSSTDKVSGIPTTTWTLDVVSLRKRFAGDLKECNALIERMKNGVRLLTRVRHPSFLRVVAPLKEHSNGDLSFVSERITCSLSERMTQLKATRNSDSWTVVSGGGGGCSDVYPPTHSNFSSSSSSKTGTATSAASSSSSSRSQQGNNNNQQQQQQKQGSGGGNKHDVLDDMFGPVNNNPIPSNQQQGGGKQQQADIFGTFNSAPTTTTTTSSASTTPTTAAITTTLDRTTSDASFPTESDVNMDALDEGEILMLLRNVATGINFFHNSCQSAHLNVAPESIVVVRGWDQDLKTASGKNNSSNSSSGGGVASKEEQRADMFREHWKIMDFTFACSFQDLDSLPSKHCDHFAKTGGVREIKALQQQPSKHAALFGGGGGGNNNNKNNNISNQQHYHQGTSGDSALVNRLLCPSLDFSAPEYVLQNKPTSSSDIFSFALLCFAVLRSAAAPNDEDLSRLPRNLNSANDIALYENQLTTLLQASMANVGWEEGTQSWIKAVHVDKNRRPDNISALMNASDALGTAAALALEKSEGIAYLDHQARLSVFHQLYKALPTMNNGTLMRHVFPVLSTVTAPNAPDLHRYIAPLAISSAAVVAKHLKVFSGKGNAGELCAEALTAIVFVFRTLFMSSDLHCAIVLLEEHAKIVPALVVIDDFTRNEGSFVTNAWQIMRDGGNSSTFSAPPSGGWINSITGTPSTSSNKDLTRSYIDLVLKAVKADNVSVATPGVSAACSLITSLSCGNDVVSNISLFSASALAAKREDTTCAESLLGLVSAQAFGMASCNTGDEVRNFAAMTTGKFVKSIIEDKAKLESGGGGSYRGSNYHSTSSSSSSSNNNNEGNPLASSIQRRTNVVRESLFPKLMQLQGQPLISCSTTQQQHWVKLVSHCGKILRVQDVGGSICGVLGTALTDGRIPDVVASSIGSELQGFVSYLASCRSAKGQPQPTTPQN